MIEALTGRTIALQTGVKRVADPILTITGLVGTAKAVHAWARAKVSYTIAVNRSDYVYEDVHAWLLGQIGQRSVRSITAASLYVPAPDGEFPERRAMRYYSDDQRSHTVRVGGYRVGVTVETPDITDISKERTKQERIVFTAYSNEARVGVQTLLEKLLAQRTGETLTPELHLMNKWGEWTRRNDIPARTMDSVILPAGQAEGLLDDLRQFLAAEDEYVRRSLPYHRGILLEGPAGTGKTSLVQALATELNLHLWYLPLKDLDRDTNLIQLVQAVPPRSILLLEDIDGFGAAHDRTKGDESPTGASLMGLLNALDGVSTPFGLISVLTSNNPERLDPALIRPGRVDYRMHIGFVGQHQANRLFENFYGRPPRANVRVTATTTAADVLGVCKRHLYSAERAEEELCPAGLKTLAS